MLVELAKNRVKEIFAIKKYKFFEAGNFNVNLIGIRSNNRVANSFDDTLLCIYKDKDIWQWKEYKITTDAGNYWLKNPMNSKGTALLVPNQYRSAYRIDRHQGRYFALCQREAEVEVYRDNNKNYITDFDPNTIDKGMFGINIHRSHPRRETKKVEKYSAGCQVFSDPEAFDRFMTICQRAAGIWGNKFSYTLLTYKDLEL